MDTMSLRTFARRTSIALALLAPIAITTAPTAHAAGEWRSGVETRLQGPRCGTFAPEAQLVYSTGFFLGSLADQESGHPHYMRVQLANIGAPCAGVVSPDIHIILGANSTLAVDATRPTACIATNLVTASIARRERCLILTSLGNHSYSVRMADANGRPMSIVLLNGFQWDLQIPITTVLPFGGVERFTASVVEASQTPSASLASVDMPIAPQPTSVPNPTDAYVPIDPVRLLETRSNVPNGQVGYTGAKPAAGATVVLQVTGHADIPEDASAVVLNVTGTNAAGGYVTVYPCDAARPAASNLNLATGATTANLVISMIGADGTVCLYTQGATDLIADVNGWFPAPNRVPAPYAPVVPERLLETRRSVGQVGYTGASPTGGSVTELQVTGRAGIADDALAVVLNVTGTNAAGGYVTVYPCGAPRPMASNLNLAAGATAANLVITKIGTDGKVCLYTQSAVDLVADVNGWFPADSAYESLVPQRLLETRRSAGQVGYSGNSPAGGTIVSLQVTGRAGVPAGASAVVLNVTATNAVGGYVTVYPCGATRPTVSSLNLAAGTTLANLAITKVGTDGKVCLYTQGAADLIADVNGWFPPTAA